MQSSPASDGGAAAAGDDLQAQLDDARTQLAAAEDRFLRARADLENYRRRSERELERRVQERSDALLLAWLDVVDSVERALAVETDADARAGLQAVLQQMQAILARQGVMRAGEVGAPFDPERHEAVAVVPGGGRETGTIAEVARSGYSIGERVLRPAQVAVARADAS